MKADSSRAMPHSLESSPLPRIVLASASPRRRELFALLGLPFEIIPSHYDEPTSPDTEVVLSDFVAHLALEKARDVAQREPNAWVIGADTEVAMGVRGAPLGKPKDAEDARRMMASLAGRKHLVCTGVALFRPQKENLPPLSIAVSTWVTFRPLSLEMIADYVATGEPMDKAGAYGAQGYAAPFIESFEGDFFNVVGLPLCALGRLLETAGLPWSAHRSRLSPADA